MNEKFECLEIGLSSYKKPVNDVLNSFGADGWELISVTISKHGNTMAYFKRKTK